MKDTEAEVELIPKELIHNLLLINGVPINEADMLASIINEMGRVVAGYREVVISRLSDEGRNAESGLEFEFTKPNEVEGDPFYSTSLSYKNGEDPKQVITCAANSERQHGYAEYRTGGVNGGSVDFDPPNFTDSDLANTKKRIKSIFIGQGLSGGIFLQIDKESMKVELRRPSQKFQC